MAAEGCCSLAVGFHNLAAGTHTAVAYQGPVLGFVVIDGSLDTEGLASDLRNSPVLTLVVEVPRHRNKTSSALHQVEREQKLVQADLLVPLVRRISCHASGREIEMHGQLRV